MNTKPAGQDNAGSDAEGRPMSEFAHLMPYASKMGTAGRLVGAIGLAMLLAGLAVLISDYTYNSHVSVYTPVAELDFEDTILRECVRREAAEQGWELSGEVRSLRCNNPSAAGMTSLAGVANLVNLAEINVAHNRLVDVEPLTRLHRLESLDLGYNELSAAALEALPLTLQSLNVDHNQLGNLEWVQELRDLVSLSAGFNQIADAAPVAGLAKLRVLDLEGNQIVDLSPLQELEHLEVLILEQNRVADVSMLAALDKLLVVDLGSNRIADVDPLASLRQLFELDLSHNPVARIDALRDAVDLGRLNLSATDVQNVAALESLGRLETVDLSATGLSCGDYRRLACALPSTQILHDLECGS